MDPATASPDAPPSAPPEEGDTLTSIRRHTNSQPGKKGFQPKLTAKQREEIIDAFITRKDFGLTKASIAAAMGISKRTVQRIYSNYKKERQAAWRKKYGLT